jgi:hypothetical protein
MRRALWCVLSAGADPTSRSFHIVRPAACACHLNAYHMLQYNNQLQQHNTPSHHTRDTRQGHNIAKNTLTEEIYKPCLPHRTYKAVWQFIGRKYPPYKWVSAAASRLRSAACSAVRCSAPPRRPRRCERCRRQLGPPQVVSPGARAHACAHAHARAYTHTHTHTRARAHTHTCATVQGPWTEADDAKLRAKQSELGNKWTEIGLLLQRHPESVADRWANLNDGRERKMGVCVCVGRSVRVCVCVFVCRTGVRVLLGAWLAAGSTTAHSHHSLCPCVHVSMCLCGCACVCVCVCLSANTGAWSDDEEKRLVDLVTSYK